MEAIDREARGVNIMIIPAVPARHCHCCYHQYSHHHNDQHVSTRKIRISFGSMSAPGMYSARMPMHATMARIFALLAFCITLYTRAQPIASVQQAVSAQPVLSSMPKAKEAKPKHKRTALDMRGKHHVSQKALSHICKNIKLKGMVKATSPRTMSRNRHALTNRDTPFGKLI